MSIPPLEWERRVQPAPAQSSPTPCPAPSPELNSTTDGAGAYGLTPSPEPSSITAPQPQAPSRGFLTIVRHGAGPSAIYVVTYRRLDCPGTTPKPVLAEGARLLLDLLERLGVNLQLSEVRGALEDILRLGSANIPSLWLSDEEMAEKGLIQE